VYYTTNTVPDVIIVKMEYALHTWERIIDFEVDTNS
jgi:hypothetical protein